MLNFTTVHQKWGIHSTYYDNERMLSLSRGGPTIWLNDKDAKAAGIEDNDWVEFWNANGAMVARAILTSRMPEGLSILQHATETVSYTHLILKTRRNGTSAWLGPRYGSPPSR